MLISFAYFRHVLDKILSGEPTETVIEEIHEYLTSLGENVRAGRVELDQYIIYKVRSPCSHLTRRLLLTLLSVYRNSERTPRTTPMPSRSLTFKSHFASSPKDSRLRRETSSLTSSVFRRAASRPRVERPPTPTIPMSFAGRVRR